MMQKQVSGKDELLGTIRCPVCVKDGGGGPLISVKGALECRGCSAVYPVFDNMVNMMPEAPGAADNKVAEFWGRDFKRRFKDTGTDDKEFAALLEDFRRGLIDKAHLLVNELGPGDLRGKSVLEIGSGAGAHAALIKSYGPRLIAMDIASERVQSTAHNLGLVAGGPAIAMKGSAMQLPFDGGTFDIVYSNGVLHHAPDTDACIKEVYRVLKPGGRAVIMLYARWALSTLLYIYGKGIKSGVIFKYPEAQWMGHVTEGGPANGAANPYTRVYSRRQLKRLFSDFKRLEIRQSSFRFFDVPVIGKYIYGLEARIHGLKKFEGGKLSSGVPWKQSSPVERRLGKYIGNCMNILAVK